MLHVPLGWMGTTERGGGAATRRGGAGKGETETFVDTDGDSALIPKPVQGELAIADI